MANIGFFVTNVSMNFQKHYTAFALVRGVLTAAINSVAMMNNVECVLKTPLHPTNAQDVGPLKTHYLLVWWRELHIRNFGSTATFVNMSLKQD